MGHQPACYMKNIYVAEMRIEFTLSNSHLDQEGYKLEQRGGVVPVRKKERSSVSKGECPEKVNTRPDLGFLAAVVAREDFEEEKRWQRREKGSGRNLDGESKRSDQIQLLLTQYEERGGNKGSCLKHSTANHRSRPLANRRKITRRSDSEDALLGTTKEITDFRSETWKEQSEIKGRRYERRGNWCAICQYFPWIRTDTSRASYMGRKEG